MVLKNQRLEPFSVLAYYLNDYLRTGFSFQKPLVSTTPVSIGGLSRDERKALSVGEAFTGHNTSKKSTIRIEPLLNLLHFSGLPLSVQDIIQLPMDEFNDLLSKHELTEEQLSLCRDIRRRGKNKVKSKIQISW